MSRGKNLFWNFLGFYIANPWFDKGLAQDFFNQFGLSVC